MVHVVPISSACHFLFFLIRRNVIANYRQERYASLESQRLISDESAQEETESDVSQEEENFVEYV